MAEYYLTKRLNALVPSDPKTAELIAALPHGATVRAVVTKPRNPAHHRLLWALLAKVVEAGANFESADALLFYLKVRLGHCDIVQGTKGHKYPMPRSISFASMDQQAFKRFYEAAVRVIVTEVLPGVTESELTQEVNAMIGDAA